MKPRLIPSEPLISSNDSCPDVREVCDLFLSTDWAAKDASLADFQAWPFALRAMVQMMFATDTPQCILWGKDLICIYNAAYWKHIALDRHPQLMGMPAAVAFQSTTIAGQIQDPHQYFNEAITTRRPVFVPEALWLRKGAPGSNVVEEIYTSYKVSTIYGDDCSPSGLLCVYSETTKNLLNARKSRVLNSLVGATQDLSTLNALRLRLHDTFDKCALDFPICLVMVSEDFLSGAWVSKSNDTDIVNYRTFAYAGMGNELSLRRVDFGGPISENDEEPGVPLFASIARRAHRARDSVTFETRRLENHCTRRAFGLPSRTGKIWPLYTEGAPQNLDPKPSGFLVLSFSPVRPIDDYILDYAKTVHEMIQHAFQKFREVIESQARLDEMNAVKKVGEQYFRVLNDLPVGVSVQDWKAQDIIFSNKRWKEILGYTEGTDLNDWADLVLFDDLPKIYQILSALQPTDPPSEHVFRVKRLHTNGKPAWITVNCSFHREQLSDGQMVTFLTTAVHDSSEQVYAKEVEVASMLENQRLEAARELAAQRADEADCAKGLFLI